MSRDFADRYITTRDPDEWELGLAIGLWVACISIGFSAAMIVLTLAGRFA